VDGIDHDAVATRVLGSGRGDNASRRVEQTLVVRRVMLLVESRRQAKIREFDMAVFVDQDIVGLDVSK
jgi:hypothetical protein